MVAQNGIVGKSADKYRNFEYRGSMDIVEYRQDDDEDCKEDRLRIADREFEDDEFGESINLNIGGQHNSMIMPNNRDLEDEDFQDIKEISIDCIEGNQSMIVHPDSHLI